MITEITDFTGIRLYLINLRDLGKGSLYLKYDESLLDVLKITFMLQKRRMFLNDRIRLFLTYADDVPMKGRIIETSIFGTVCTARSLVLLIMLKNCICNCQRTMADTPNLMVVKQVCPSIYSRPNIFHLSSFINIFPVFI